MPANSHLMPPFGYFELVCLEKLCGIVGADSVGVHNDAFSHGKLSLPLRDKIKWAELVEAGVNILVGGGAQAIVKPLPCRQISFSGDRLLYGMGNAPLHILMALCK